MQQNRKVCLNQEDRTELGHRKGITHHNPAGLDPNLLLGKEVVPGLALVMVKGVVAILGVDQEIAPDLQPLGRGNLVALALEVAPGIERREILVVGQDHVIDTLEGPVQTVVKKIEIDEHIEDLTHGLDLALVTEDEAIVHVPETDITECFGRLGVGNRLTVFVV